jgi:hypothetical protein
MLPYPGALMDQPDGVIHRFEVIMRIRDEEERKVINNQGPPPKD